MLRCAVAREMDWFPLWGDVLTRGSGGDLSHPVRFNGCVGVGGGGGATHILCIHFNGCWGCGVTLNPKEVCHVVGITPHPSGVSLWCLDQTLG